MQNSVSIVITTFNDEDNLALTLQSVREQLGIHQQQVEVVISDGGSTDSTPSILAEYSDIITLVDSRPDAGVYDGMNIGAALATGDWLHFLNAGDTFNNPNCLETWCQAVNIGADEHAWIVAGAINMRSNMAPPVRIPNMPHRWWKHGLGLQPHCHQATWFRRSVFEAMGGYSLDFDIAGDFDLILRFGLVSRPLEIPSLLINYLGGGMSEVRGALIPGCQHAIRAERFNYGRGTATIDLTVAKMVGRLNITRRRVGALRLRLMRA